MANAPTPKKKANRFLAAAVAGLFLLGGGAAAWLWPRPAPDLSGETYRVFPRDLVISVTEGGSLVTHGALEIKSEVEGSTTIISVVPDGTVLTEKDVKEGKVLIQLDTSKLQEQHDQQVITVQNAEASFAQSRESFLIQKNQNESNIKDGELKVKFARMDLDKSLGNDLADKVLSGKVDLLRLPNGGADWNALPEFLEREGLGGESLKQLRKLQSDIDLAAEELKRAENKYGFSQTLGEKGYITREEVEADKLAVKRQTVAVEQARLALQLYLRYQLPKDAEKLLSDYVEAGKELERIKAKARAELSKSEVNLQSNENTYLRQKDRLQKLRDQLDKCTIRAPRPGMVVYATTGQRWSRDVIEPGAGVRERQKLFTIPDPTNMAVELKVHESAVRKVKPGLRTRLIPDSMKDLVLWGTVKSVAIMPDSTNWMNPDLKVYNTIITLDEYPPELKPGMSVQAEIIVDTLRNVMAVPIQAVTTVAGKRVCYVRDGEGYRETPVETGDSNDKMIHILSGLREGDLVLLHPPILAETGKPLDAETAEEGGRPAEPEKKQPAGPETPRSPGLPENGGGAEKPAEHELTAEAQAAVAAAPEDRREALAARLKAMTAEEQRDWVKRMAEGRRSGRRGRNRGGSNGGAEGGAP